jgi:DNA invertase Pin-like site-specific DNA recombinase
VALIDHLGRLPRPGYQANHHCDNPVCISTAPGHLYEGTQQENVADRHARGRDARNSFPGESNGYAKLTREQVDEIRRRYATGAETQYVIADAFGIDQSHVSLIVRHKIWR